MKLIAIFAARGRLAEPIVGLGLTGVVVVVVVVVGRGNMAVGFEMGESGLGYVWMFV